MNRREKYQFLRSIGLSSELARKWRDRKIENLESMNKDIILKNNKELKKELDNFIIRKRYNFLRELGLSSNRARKLSKHKTIEVDTLSMRKNKIIKNKEYYKLQEYVKKEYPVLSTLSIEPEIKTFINKYKNIENYGVYTKWGTITRIEPFKHETHLLVNKIREVFNANEKQGYYILYLMYQEGKSIDEIIRIIKTDILYEIYGKEGK